MGALLLKLNVWRSLSTLKNMMRGERFAIERHFDLFFECFC